jgi:hypothetical protein
MHWTLVFFEWKAGWWRSRAQLRSDESADLFWGIEAYAEKQAVLLERRAASYAKYWMPALKDKGLTPSWLVRYTGTEVEVAEQAGGDVEEDEDQDNSASEGEDLDMREDQIYDDFEIGV